jgi:hypothetical protein
MYNRVIESLLLKFRKYKPVLNILPINKWIDVYEGSFDPKVFKKEKVLNIYKSKSPLHWINGDITYTNYTIGMKPEFDELFKKSDNIQCRDSYGSIVLDEEYLLLNNYDAPTPTIPRGHVHIYDLCTVDIRGNVEYVSIAVSIRKMEYVVVKHIKRQLPEQITDMYQGMELLNLFGGKRAFRYEGGDILSIRTINDVYDIIPDMYKQSDEFKDNMSYPRLQLVESRVKKIDKIFNI